MHRSYINQHCITYCISLRSFYFVLLPSGILVCTGSKHMHESLPSEIYCSCHTPINEPIKVECGSVSIERACLLFSILSVILFQTFMVYRIDGVSSP